MAVLLVMLGRSSMSLCEGHTFLSPSNHAKTGHDHLEEYNHRHLVSKVGREVESQTKDSRQAFHLVARGMKGSSGAEATRMKAYMTCGCCTGHTGTQPR